MIVMATVAVIRALSFHRDIHALVDGVQGIDLEIRHPRLDHEIISFMPHEEPGRVPDDTVLGLTVETIAKFFVHGLLCRFDQPVEFRIDAACLIPGGTDARRVEERKEEVFRVRIVGPPG
jgi:hypothetical protein